MNEEEFKRAAISAMSDTNPLPVMITIADAWYLVSGLQLAVRHPELHTPLKVKLRQIALQFAAQIELDHPEAGEALAMGWDQNADSLLDDDPDVIF